MIDRAHLGQQLVTRDSSKETAEARTPLARTDDPVGSAALFPLPLTQPAFETGPAPATRLGPVVAAATLPLPPGLS